MLGAGQVKRLPGDGVRLGFELHNALPQGCALRGQRGRVDQHPVSLYAKQGFASGHFELVDRQQFRVLRQSRPQRAVHVQSLVGIFTRVFRSTSYIDLRKGDLVRAFATQIFIGQTGTTHMTQGQAAQAMRFVHFEHIALQHGVVLIAAHLNALVGQHMPVVFDVLPQLRAAGVFQPRAQLTQYLLHGQLRWSVRAAVSQGDVGRMARLVT